MLEFPRLRLAHRVLALERARHLHRLTHRLAERQRAAQTLERQRQRAAQTLRRFIIAISYLRGADYAFTGVSQLVS